MPAATSTPTKTPGKGATGTRAQRAADEELGSSLRIAVMRLTRRLRAERSEQTLTLTQLSALSSLHHHGPISPTALAELERVQPPSMTRVIAVLEERGLAERAPHPSDRRQSLIAISTAGLELIKENRRRRDAWLALVLQTLTPTERDTLRAAVPILERLGEA
ncbi:MAG TPA: MarR family transcriptional regulator [Acidimicrobiales bacterium]|nr:MarR family transcriptional regulator [Acidimicrobiales bacterium]